MREVSNKISAIVVGAGPSGVSAAVTIARKGHQVLLIERGDFAGAKNMFGGVVYTDALKEIFPNFVENAPVERYSIEHRYALLTDNEATTVSYKSDDNNVSFTTIRAKFDRWAVDEAKKEGVYFAPKTTVRSLIVKDGKVVGIKTDLEEYYCDVVILADGVNSLLAKQIGLRKDFKPSDVALGVKEVIKLPKEVINERFNINDNQGVIYEILGGALKEMLGLGFLYTNNDSVTIGIGVALDELKRIKKKPYELLDEIKQHPSIEPLLKDGEIKEYSAHLIPEGGYNAIPKLYSDGVLVVGDAAMLVNNIHWEGTNLAFISGKFAGEAVNEAIEKSDFSKNVLKHYQTKLEKSFIMKDLKSYKNVMPTIHSRSKSFLGFYPQKINEFFKIFTSVNSIPKKVLFRNYIKSFFTKRCICEYFKDAFSMIKLIFEAIK